MMIAFCIATPNSAMKPTERSDIERGVGQVQGDEAAQRRERDHAEDQHDLPEQRELSVEQQGHQRRT